MAQFIYCRAPLTKIMPETEFNANGYLKGTRLDREGGKTVTFEFSAKDALELAKLELMGRDLNNHLPILLEINAKQTSEKKKDSRATSKIRNSRGIAAKNKRVF